MNSPLEIPGCVGWIESKGESAINMLTAKTGRKQTIIFSTDHDDQDHETLLIYDGELTVDQRSKLNAYLTRGTEQFTAETKIKLA